MRKTGKKVKPKNRRHIEDVPFYKFKYEKEDLPLDPAKEFILEEIRLLKQVKPRQFHKDFELYSYMSSSKTATDGLKLPPIYQVIEERQAPHFAFEGGSNEFCWLNDSSEINEDKTEEITKKLIKAHKNGRLQIFHDLARTKAALRSKEFFRRYKYPSETIGSRGKRGPLCRRKEKPKKYRLNEWAIRNLEEIAIERQKVQAYLKKMIEADIARARKEEQKKQREIEEKKKKIEQAKRRAELKEQIKNLPNEEYMRRLKRREKKTFEYLQALYPIDLDLQKEQGLLRFGRELCMAENSFTPSMRERTLRLMSAINVRQIEAYPSKLIIKILPKIDKKLTFLKKAHKFVMEETKHWPDVYPEIILLDFLFDSENKIPKHLAVFIIILLMDLQEDYKNYIKRGFIKYLLK